MKLKTAIIGVMMTIFGFAALSNTPVMAAVTCPTGTVREGQSASSFGECNTEEDPSGGGLMPTIKTIINTMIGVTGLIAVIMIVIGGINYVTSQGDPQKTKKATNTVLFSVIGLVVAILSFAIVNFVLDKVF